MFELNKISFLYEQRTNLKNGSKSNHIKKNINSEKSPFEN